MKRTNQFKALLYQIEKTRQTLEHLVRIGDTDRSTGMLLALNAMYTELFEINRKQELEKQRAARAWDYRLVFSKQYPDGQVLSQTEYVELCKRMDREDRETHIAVDVDPESAPQVATLVESDQQETVYKRAK